MMTRVSFSFVITALVLALPVDVAAEREFSTVFRYYDDGKTQVMSPAMEIGSTFNEDRMKITGHFAQDVLTSASSEVRTFASKGKIEELRNEFQVNYETQIPDGTLSVGLVTSDEKDYSSRIVSAGGSREFFTKNTVVGFGFSSGADVITSSADASFKQDMNHQVYSISLSQIISRNALFQVLYDFRVENGFIASPYRRAKLITSSGIVALNENHPRTRNRNAFGFKYNFYNPRWKLSFATSYRLYQDSWGILSHTVDERITKEFSRKFETALTLRFYTQSKASFYQDYYHGDPGVFYSGNNTLATYNSYAVGLRPAYNITDNMNFSIKFEYFTQSFQDATDAGNLSTLSDDKKLSISAFVIGAGLTA
ncbi:MAG: DUF3570 domain-containing protein, partial [Bdellovibrionales bacterium]|nr:DUF3570 domain-containing protein [Bdellovibrionales bacterium]